MLFPQAIGSFQRAMPSIYDRGGRDVSGGYNLLRQGNPIVVTVYVYPAPPLIAVGSPDYIINDARARLLKGEFVRREQEIEQSHPNAVLLREARTVLAAGGMASPGWTADFSYTESFSAGPAAVRSKLVVAQCPDAHWKAEYRFTSRGGISEDNEIASFMQALALQVPRQAIPAKMTGGNSHF